MRLDAHLPMARIDWLPSVQRLREFGVNENESIGLEGGGR